MIRLELAVGALAREAMRTAKLLRAKELGPIPCDEGPAAQPPESLVQGRLREQRFQALETGREQRRVRRVQHVADVIVGRNFPDPEQGLAIGAALAFLQRALERQKRGALHEEHREGGKAEIRHGDVAAASLTRVRKGGANGFQTLSLIHISEPTRLGMIS